MILRLQLFVIDSFEVNSTKVNYTYNVHLYYAYICTYYRSDYGFIADEVSEAGQTALNNTEHLVAGALTFIAGETFEVANCEVRLTETL